MLNQPSPPSGEASSLQGQAHAGRLLAAIVESSDDAILAKDLNGVITSWNPAASRLYGYALAEVVGRSVSILVPPELDNDLPSLMECVRRGEPVQNYETVRMARDGRRVEVALTISPIREEGGRVIGASTIARDVSGRKLEARRWRLLSEVGQALGGILDAEEVLRELARRLVPEMADYAITYLADGAIIRRVGAAHAEPAKAPLVERLVQLAAPALEDELGAGAVIRTGEAILAAEVSPELLERAGRGGEYLEVLRALDPVSGMVLPLRARGRTVGAVAFATTGVSSRRYDEAALTFGLEVADRAALALDNARLLQDSRLELARRQEMEEALRHRYEQLRVLYDMTRAVGRAAALEEIYDRALDGLRRALGVRRASILLFDEQGRMRFRAWRGLSEAYRRAVDGHTPWSAETRDPAPICISDIRHDRGVEEALRATVLAEGIQALAFIPLVFRSQLLGKFMLYYDEPHSFDAEELELARTVAGTVAFGLARMRDEQSIRESKATAERANEAKSQFLGVMSHELRTPLNAVVGYADLLLVEVSGPLTASQREHVERIQASARHQLVLVEEILAYTRLEAGGEEPRWIETDARRVLADVAELLRPEAEAKQLALRVEAPEGVPIVTDPAKLRQIAINLAGNAVKYTERGEVVMRARLEGASFWLEVRDTGPGIPGDKLDYIFQPFTQVDETRTRVSAGTGLGLAIVRQLAELLGGEVTVESRLGEGSAFSLRLPRTTRSVSSR